MLGINVNVLGDSIRLALDLCVGRLFQQTRVMYLAVVRYSVHSEIVVANYDLKYG